MDADQWGPDCLRAYKNECEADKNPAVERIFRPRGGGEPFGTYVRMEDTEMELGMLLLLLPLPPCSEIFEATC
jgi:hypothetical protein